jgi:hypothetical protein
MNFLQNILNTHLDAQYYDLELEWWAQAKDHAC